MCMPFRRKEWKSLCGLIHQFYKSDDIGVATVYHRPPHSVAIRKDKVYYCSSESKHPASVVVFVKRCYVHQFGSSDFKSFNFDYSSGNSRTDMLLVVY